MSIQVLNTGSQLAGKTLVAAETADTITGLKTFDRGAAPPFAVGASATKVPGLDADKVDGFDISGWQSYTPVWSGNGGTPPSLGNGTINGQYLLVGKICFFELILQAGTTSNGGVGSTWLFSLPPVTVSGSFPFAGAGFGFIQKGGNYYPVAAPFGYFTTTDFHLAYNNAPVVNGTPVTIAANDRIRVNGFFSVN